LGPLGHPQDGDTTFIIPIGLYLGELLAPDMREALLGNTKH